MATTDNVWGLTPEELAEVESDPLADPFDAQSREITKAYQGEVARLQRERPAELLESVPPLLRPEAADALLPPTAAPPRAEPGWGPGEGVGPFAEIPPAAAPYPLPEDAGKMLVDEGLRAVEAPEPTELPPLRDLLGRRAIPEEDLREIKTLEKSVGLGEVPEGLTPVEEGLYRDLVKARGRVEEMAAESPAFRRALESGELSLVEKKEPTLAAGARKTISSFLGTDEPPDVLTQVAAGDPIAWSKLTGKAIPWGTWYDTLYREHRQDLINRYIDENEARGGLDAMSEPEYFTLEKEARERAQKELKSISTTIPGLVFLGYGQQELEDIMEKPAWLRVPTALASPPGQHEGGMISRSSITRRPYDALLRSAVVSEGLAAMLSHSAPEDATDIPGWILREAGSPETVRAAYYGESNIFDFIEPIGAKIAGEDADRTTKLLAGGVPITALILTEPDAFSLALGPIGIAGKLGIGALRAFHLASASKKLQKARKEIEAGESIEIAIDTINNSDPVLGQIVSQKVATELSKSGDIKSILQTNHRAQIKATELASKKRLEAQKLTDAAQANRAEKDALEAEVYAHDMQLYNEELIAAHLERRRDALLDLLPAEGKDALKSKVYNWNTFERRMDKAIQAESQKIDAVRQSRREAFKASENVDKFYGDLVNGLGLRAPGSSLDDGRVVLDIDFGPKAPVYKLDDGTELSSGVEIKAKDRKTLGSLRKKSEDWKVELREPRNQIAVHRKAIEDLSRYRDGRGGVQDAIDAAREARVGVTDAKKALIAWRTSNMKRLKELRVPYMEADKVLRQAQKAVDKAFAEGKDIKEVMVRTLNDLTSEMSSYSKEFRKDLGKRALTSSLREMQDYGLRVSDKGISDQFSRILRGATKVDKVTKEMGMEGEKLARTILKTLRSDKFEDSEAIFARYLQSPEGRPLAAALSAPGAKIYAPKAAAEIQRSLLGLLTEVHKSRVFGDQNIWAKAYTEALRDPTFGKRRGSHAVLRFIEGAIQGNRQIAKRLGTYNEDVEGLVRTADNLLAIGSREALEHFQRFRGLRGADEIIKWLDAPGPARAERLAGIVRDPKLGVSVFDEATGPGSKWEKARRNIIDDSRIDPAALERAEAQALDTKTALLAQLDKVITDNQLDEDTADALRKLLADADSGDMASARLVLDSPEELAREVAPLAVTSLSRMWFPGFMRGPDKAKIALMVGLTRKIARDSETYKDFAQKMQDATEAVIGGADTSPLGVARSHAMASTAILHAAVLDNLARGMAKVMGPRLSPEGVADMNRLLTGDWQNVKDATAAQQNLLSLGMPVTQPAMAKRVGFMNRQIVRESREFVAMGIDGTGETVFTPRNILKDIDSQTRGIVKALEPTKLETPWDGLLVGGAEAYKGMLSLWRQSILSGTILPNARYWTNNIAGDMSQLWLDEGLVRSGKLSTMNFLSNIPGIGRPLQEVLYNSIAWGVEKGQKVTKGTPFEILPSITESIFNPLLGRIFAGRDGYLVTKDGQILEFARLRQEAAEDGILVSQITEEMTEAYTRTANATGLRKFPYYFKWWNRQMADHADMVQQRQRMALYCDLRRGGVSRKEAQKRVLNALYDWKHGTVEVELAGLQMVSPFWRFWKLAQRQILRTMTDPLTEPSLAQMKRALTGKSGLARVRQQAQFAAGIPRLNLLSEEDQEMIRSEAKEMQELLSMLYPKWLHSRILADMRAASMQRREYFAREHGKQIDSIAYVMPSMTALDTWQIIHGMMSGLRMVAAAASRAAGGGPMELPADLEGELFEPALSRLWGPAEVAARAGLSTLGFDLDYEPGKGGARYIKQDEALFLKLVNDFSGVKLYEEDPETGRTTTSVPTYMGLRMMPGLATAGDLAKSTWGNPAWEEGTAEGISYMLRQLTRFGHEVAYSGEREAKALQAGMVRKMGERPLKKIRGPSIEGARQFSERWAEGRPYREEELPKIPED